MTTKQEYNLHTPLKAKLEGWRLNILDQAPYRAVLWDDISKPPQLLIQRFDGTIWQDTPACYELEGLLNNLHRLPEMWMIPIVTTMQWYLALPGLIEAVEEATQILTDRQLENENWR